jgi:diguanylate cyclase (GGDEF)-like protein
MRLTPALLGSALEGAPDAAAAAATVVDHVAHEQRLLPAVYLARGGRLRCAALRGYWQARDGLPGRAGIMGRTYRTATETVVPDVTASPDYLEANPGVVAEACFPVLAGGLTVGVLNVESREPLHESDLEHLRECAEALGARIEELGGLPSESATQRLLRHVADLAALQDPEAVADGLLSAALDLVPLGSALLARTSGRDGRLRPSCAAGPLAPVLRDAGLESIADWVQDGISCFTVGEPEPPPAAANLADLRAAGVETMIAVGLFVQGELLGALVLASAEPAVINTDDVELLEQLATHGAACLRTAELLGSLRERAESDPLTGLGHHATFHEALAGSHRRPTTAVVVCDIDGFKLLNDTYGHGHGDRVLCGVADAMSSALRRGDRLFRVGGDEFAGLLAVESREQALGAAARLRDAVLEARLGVTVSIGVAVPHADETDVALLARADRALYSVKAAGRDGVALANDEPLTAPPALG